MRRIWIDIKKGISAAAILLASAGLVWGAMNVQAKEEELIGKSRGYVNVDLRTFSEIHSSVDGKDDRYLMPKENSDGAKYELGVWQDFFGDRDDNGVTYRSGSAYDMTDVTHIVLHGYASRSNNGDSDEDKLLFYINESSNTYYTQKSYKDINASLVSGNGIVDYYNNFWLHGNKYQRYQFPINARYSDSYVYLGMSCDWRAYWRKFQLNNSQIIEEDETAGCIALKLKEHKITLIEPEKLPQVVVDEKGVSTTKMIAPWGDLKLANEAGKKYSIGNTTSVYRDEQLTLLYSLASGTSCKLDGFKIYSDSKKTKLIYTMDVKNADNHCTFTFDSAMIQEIEKVTGKYKLEDMYIQPVFSIPDVTVEFSSSVVEASGLVEVAETSAGSRVFELREKGYTDSSDVIGTFVLNNAAHIGDGLTVDYTKNKNYTGAYEFRYYEFRVCDSSNQVSGADINTAEASADKIDIQQTLSDTYFWMRAHISLKATVTLEPKTVVFNNREVKINEAAVTGIEGKPQPTGKIRYHYYTDAACTKELEEDTYPINAGDYYVTATLGQDEYYASVTSQPVLLRIEKAKPVLKNLKGTSIAFGQKISESVPGGDAYGVTNQKISGTFAWENADNKTADKVGSITENLVFTPDENWNTNYSSATGTAAIKIGKATPTVTVMPEDKVYDGNPVTSVPVTVTGVYGEETGQKVYFDFYRLVNGEYKSMKEAPVNAGTYYVSAYVSGNDNYGYAESEMAVMQIKKRESDLVIVPIDDTTYRVYVTNTVDTAGPSGKINLSADGEASGMEQPVVTETMGEKVRYFAEFTRSGRPHTLKAAYVPVFDDNYLVNEVELELPNDPVYPDDPEESKENHISVVLTYGDSINNSAVLDVKQIPAVKETEISEMSVRWLNKEIVSDRDVVNLQEETGELIVSVENAGEETVIAYVTGNVAGTDSTITKKSWYVFFDITVQRGSVTVEVPDRTATYSGEPVAAAAAAVTPAAMPLTYTYYTDAACTQELNELPVNAGTYYVKARTEATRNYVAGEGTGKVIIHPAQVQLEVSDKTVTYTGEKQGVNQPVVTGIEPTGTVVICYGCGDEACDGCEEPVNAGTYNVRAIYLPGEKDNYARTIANATLVIEPAECVLELMPKETVYTGDAVEIEAPVVTGVNGEGYDKVQGNIAYFYSLSTEIDYQSTVPTEAGLYYVYAYRAAEGNYKAAISNRTTLIIKPAELTAVLEDVDTVYNGKDVQMGMLSPVKIKNQNNEAITLDSVQYEYYLDEAATIKIPSEYPKDAGTYYVKAVVSGGRNYSAAQSNTAKLVIEKAVPVISEISATSILYGDMAEKSVLTGNAAGVNGEVPAGLFTWEEAIGHEKYEAGTKILNVIFTPDGEWQKNYTKATGTAELTVEIAEPELKGSDKSVIYDGEAKTLAPVEVQGVADMKDPTGTVVYRYFSDEECTKEVSEVKDAGNYYCVATYQPDEDEKNYKETSSRYQLIIEKADAVIVLKAIPDLDTKSVTLAGAVVGLMDDPTGSIELFVRSDGTDTYTSMGTVALEGRLWSEFAFVHKLDNANGEYDFKAIYREGEKQNYNIMDGEVFGVELDKEPQHIYFEETVIDKVYGDADFKVHALMEGQGSTGDITYRVVQKFGNPNAVTINDDGMVSIKDTGYAFLMATKEGDDSYGTAYAVAMIRISKAPVEIELTDESVVYDGKEKELRSVKVVSNGKSVDVEDEFIQMMYSYKHLETGRILEDLPVEAGEYEVRIHTEETRHYETSGEAVAKLMIEKAKAEIRLEKLEKDKENKKVSLEGTIEGLFDHPTGTITLYQKKHGQSDDAYTVVAEGLEVIINEDGTFGFVVQADVELNKAYDFKAVYAEGRVQNYTIEAGELKNVIVVGFGDDDDENDNSRPEDGDKPGDGDTSQNDGSGDSGAVDTRDMNNPVKYWMFITLSLLLAIAAKKVGRR